MKSTDALVSCCDVLDCTVGREMFQSASGIRGANARTPRRSGPLGAEFHNNNDRAYITAGGYRDDEQCMLEKVALETLVVFSAAQQGSYGRNRELLDAIKAMQRTSTWHSASASASSSLSSSSSSLPSSICALVEIVESHQAQILDDCRRGAQAGDALVLAIKQSNFENNALTTKTAAEAKENTRDAVFAANANSIEASGRWAATAVAEANVASSILANEMAILSALAIKDAVSDAKAASDALAKVTARKATFQMLDALAEAKQVSGRLAEHTAIESALALEDAVKDANATSNALALNLALQTDLALKGAVEDAIAFGEKTATATAVTTARLVAKKSELIRLQEALEIKRKFVRFTSHEIRTPLSTVLMGLTLLESSGESIASMLNKAAVASSDSWDSSSGAAAATSDCIGRAITELNEMNSVASECKESCHIAVDILNDLLLYEKIDSENVELTLTRQTAVGLVSEALKPFAINAKSKNVTLIIEQVSSATSTMCLDDVSLSVDKGKVLKVFRNLASNAIKFSHTDGTVTVRLSVVAANSEPQIARQFRVEVVDDGPGISIANQTRLFGEMVQFNATELQGEGNGSGLGLYLSKGIMEMHKGTLSMYSAGEGHGCTFAVEFPIGESLGSPQERRRGGRFGPKSALDPLMTSPSPRMNTVSSELVAVIDDDDEGQYDGPGDGSYEAKPLRLTNLKVLIVDDAQSIRKMLARSLAKASICLPKDIDFACDGIEGLRKMEQALQAGFEYDVVIMDSVMPNMTGPQAVQAARAKGYTGLVVAVTGNALQVDIDSFLQYGADEVILKPLDMDELIGAIIRRQSRVVYE
jgi:signal transduction histidine kinase/ActR/RegA family two-component response regulator